MHPQAVDAREVRMTPVAPHVQLHEPEHPLLMVLEGQRVRWLSDAGCFFVLNAKKYITNVNGDPHLKFEGLH